MAINEQTAAFSVSAATSDHWKVGTWLSTSSETKIEAMGFLLSAATLIKKKRSAT